MQKYIAILTVILTSFVANAQNNTNNSYTKQWFEVEKLELEGLPKSALALVLEIYNKAKKERNDVQLIKSLIYKSKFALTLEEDATLQIITDLKTTAKNSTTPISNILHSIIADIYYQYYQQNRWQFYQRTHTATKVDSIDFRTWDLATIFAETGKHFKKSLKSALELQEIELEKFNGILHLAENSKKHRPTLYDFLAQRALDFYTTDEQYLTRPAFKFELDNPKFLSDNKEFTKIQFKAKDSMAQALQALKILKNITLFHQKSKHPEALIKVSLQRLQFVLNNAVFKDKDSLYIRTLEHLKRQFKDNGIVTEADYALANQYYILAEKYKLGIFENYRFYKRKALEICLKAANTYPKTTGAEKCKSLADKITNKELTITNEQFIPIKKHSKVLVNYKNIDTLNFKAFKISLNQWEKLNKIYSNSDRISFIKKLKEVANWQTELKDERDYLNHSSEIAVPKLEQGNYLLFASTKKGLNSDNTFAYNIVQVTDIALIENIMFGKYHYQVVNRNTGKPLQNATINLKNYQTGRYNKAINRNMVTDKNGMAVFTIDKYRTNVKITIVHKGDKAVFGDFYLYENNYHKPINNEAYRQVFLFTNRSIYRPGQTVHFKGIAVKMENAKSEVIANRKVTVHLLDVNRQEIKKLSLKTNEFGSFSGELILPSSGLTGTFTIEVKNTDVFQYGFGGNTSISVEEYKRPKFETSFKPVTETFRLNDSITIKGTAIAYAGSNITNAKVAYRIVRTAQFPDWWYWRRPYYSSEEMEITNGITETNAQGSYTLTFKAIPDTSIDPKTQPVFNYRVIADVTDLNGETRTAETVVNVGYHALTINLDTPSQLDKTVKNHQIKIATENLNGQFVPIKGELNIYKLIAPKNTLRNRPWETPDYQLVNREKFKEMFPYEAYKNENNPEFWDIGQNVFSKEFNTKDNKEIALKELKNWASGKYKVVARAKDKFGQDVKTEQIITIFSPKDKKVTDNQLINVSTDKNEYLPDEKVKLKIGSASKDLWITVTVVKKYEIVKQEVIHLSDEIKTLEIPVTKDDLGGFSILYQLVNINHFLNGHEQINVPYPKKELTIETSTFRDKLQPGQEETFRFTIKGDKKDKVTAEMLASMYDASLDQFKPHYWYFSPIRYPGYYLYNYSHANHSFGTDNFKTIIQNNSYISFNPQKYDKLNWFGFSLINSWANNSYLDVIRQKHDIKPADFTSKIEPDKKDGYVFGQVTDGKHTLPGVNVIIKGTTRGTQTDFDGNFKIKAKPGETLIITYVGFQSVKLTLSADNFYKIALSESKTALDEVVVIGHGTKKRKMIRGVAPASTERVMDNLEELAEVEEEVMEYADKALPAQMAEINKEKRGEGDKNKTDMKLDIGNIAVRKNLKETAFFYPQLTTDADGNISFNFTAPESLTKWKLQLLTHTKDLAFDQKEMTVVTQKELMVIPNPPRFFRQGDTIVFSSKIANLTEKKLTGSSQLFLYDAFTNKPIDQKLGNNTGKKNFDVAAKGNTQISFTLQIPDDIQAVKYKIVAKADNFSDGEENALPVLTNRMLVTETLPLWVRSNQTKTFTLDKMKNHNSTSLKNYNLSLEVTSNPAWYAVQALPYLMEYPYECSEQTFARYYANALGSHVATSNPRIQEVFEQWKNSDALLSNLEKNEELKSLIIQETPWLRSAQSEAEQKKRIALLFNLNKMKNELDAALRKLERMQMNNGGFPWFMGSHYPNRYITQYIVTGLGHLQHLNVISNNSDKSVTKITDKALSFLDNEIYDDFKKLKKQAKKIEKRATNKAEAKRLVRAFWADNHTGTVQIQYLYMRSFFGNKPIPTKAQKAVSYFTRQSYKFWMDNNLYSKGLIALIAHRNGEKTITEKILASLKENAVYNEELGMYWKKNQAGYFWYQAPVEIQALMIEAFSEIAADTKTVDELKVWLLKNKQTNSWKTTKATSEAVYALLLQGSNWLEDTDLVKMKIGNSTIAPEKTENINAEAGTGYFKTSWKGEEIQPEMATVTLEKNTDGIAWGALYWQYFEDLDKITSAKTPLQLSKKLFLKENTATGEQLKKIAPGITLEIGDLIRVRIEIKVDRGMEFVHMKDMRAAGFEPVDVLSQYKWQDGLGYYQSTKDAATNFFFSYLPQGVYVFEYDLRVNNAGNFSNGITTIQSMYAPEFSSHSKGVRIEVQ
ncbi:MAG: alpha-2-macroglobulin [Flavobacteriales bacterium]|nr:MAG: alpha-2-macroglobulin [Flavobacteriales bacterium]